MEMRRLYTKVDHGRRRTWTLSEIAERFGVAVSVVSRSVQAGAKTIYGPPLSEAEVTDIRKRRERNETWPEIGGAYGRSCGWLYNTVKRYCTENNLLFK
jgi:hypothetical protein